VGTITENKDSDSLIGKTVHFSAMNLGKREIFCLRLTSPVIGQGLTEITTNPKSVMLCEILTAG
jgi:hypothetical protein